MYDYWGRHLENLIDDRDTHRAITRDDTVVLDRARRNRSD